jgi:hypothetical protein
MLYAACGVVFGNFTVAEAAMNLAVSGLLTP